MKTTTVLLCLVACSSFGRDYAEGDHVDPADFGNDPEPTLSNRLAHGFFKFTTVTEAEDSDTLNQQDALITELEAMSKADLAAYALEKFGAAIDKDKMNKADMLLEISTLAAQ